MKNKRKSTKPKAKRAQKSKPAPKQRSSDIKASLQAWATALGMERRTLDGRLVKAGLQIPKHGDISARQIYVALLGDKEAEQVRALKLDNEERERNAAEEVGRLFPMEELEAWLSKNYIIPMSNIFAGMAASIDTRCNPENPKLARQAIEAFIESTVKPSLRSGLEKPQPKKSDK